MQLRLVIALVLLGAVVVQAEGTFVYARVSLSSVLKFA